MNTLDGRCVLVIGASSGLGRASAIALARGGADVVFAARRRDALADAVSEAGRGHVVTIDVADPADITDRIAEVVQALRGPLDGVLYTAGMSPMAPMTQVTLEQWQQVFTVNTFGPSLVIGAALDHLADDAVVAVVSSDSSLQPRHSLVPYAASKRALEATLEGWRTEVPGGRRFVSVILGPTYPTEFANDFDPDLFAAAHEHWQRQGFSIGLMEADAVARGLVGMFDSLWAAPSFGIETVLLRAPAPDPDNPPELPDV